MTFPVAVDRSAAVYASVPALGGLAVGALRAATPGFDAPGAAPAPAFARALAAVATLGTGNSLGPEGPAVALGTTIAKTVDGAGGRNATKRRARILENAGQAAGVAAGFSAPRRRGGPRAPSKTRRSERGAGTFLSSSQRLFESRDRPLNVLSDSSVRT